MFCMTLCFQIVALYLGRVCIVVLRIHCLTFSFHVQLRFYSVGERPLLTSCWCLPPCPLCKSRPKRRSTGTCSILSVCLNFWLLSGSLICSFKVLSARRLTICWFLFPIYSMTLLQNSFLRCETWCELEALSRQVRDSMPTISQAAWTSFIVLRPRRRSLPRSANCW
jgi:hypothetical protein